MKRIVYLFILIMGISFVFANLSIPSPPPAPTLNSQDSINNSYLENNILPSEENSLNYSILVYFMLGVLVLGLISFSIVKKLKKKK